MKKTTILGIILVALFLFGCEKDVEVQRIPALEVPCEAFRDEFEKSECYMEKAIDDRDKALCEEKVTDSNHKSRCLAVVDEDEGLCEGISDDSMKDKCYRDVAYETYSGDVCDNIASEDLRDDCYDYIAMNTFDEALCKRKSSGKDGCLREVAGLKDDEAICEDIDSEDNRYWCLAVAKNDANFCEKMSKYQNLCADDYLIG